MVPKSENQKEMHFRVLIENVLEDKSFVIFLNER